MTMPPLYARVLATCAVLIAVPEVASAQYLDPGSGSIIVQALIAGAVAAAAGIKLYWGRISSFFARRAKNENAR
jgi:hypothetical protein